MRPLQPLTLASPLALAFALIAPIALFAPDAVASEAGPDDQPVLAPNREAAVPDPVPSGEAPARPDEPGADQVCSQDEATGELACVDAPPPPPEPFALVGEQVEPGERRSLDWSGAPRDGDGRGLPVTVAHGLAGGPVLCLFAAVHGDEINGIEAVRQVVQRTDPQLLSGTLVAVPVVNLGGYARGSRYMPDRRDLNRAFPGSPRGSAAARLAHALFDNIVRSCDAVVDFHTGSFDRDNLPQLRADLRTPATLDLVRGFGATLVLHSPGQKGMLRRASAEAGIPAATFEVGAPGVLQPPMIEVAVSAIERLMHRLGMRDSVLPEAMEPQPVFYESRWVRAETPGLLMSEVELGQRVAPGQRLGRVIDPLSDREVELLSPFHGRVLGMSQNRQVLPGYALFHLGEQTSEAAAVQEAVVAPEGAADDEEDPEQSARD